MATHEPWSEFELSRVPLVPSEAVKELLNGFLTSWRSDYLNPGKSIAENTQRLRDVCDQFLVQVERQLQSVCTGGSPGGSLCNTSEGLSTNQLVEFQTYRTEIHYLRSALEEWIVLPSADSEVHEDVGVAMFLTEIEQIDKGIIGVLSRMNVGWVSDFQEMCWNRTHKIKEAMKSALV